MRQLVSLIFGFALISCSVQPDQPDSVILSVVGTNDVHGELLGERGGLATFSGYIRALRAQRETDGALILLDAGDMWQGTLESNLNEGAQVVQAYNALAYDAAAIGNHEFDFGPVGDSPIPVSASDDPRGALKARAREAKFPLLAANLIDHERNLPVDWDNVTPSILLERAGLRIGVIGVTTADTLATTIVANTTGLRIAALGQTIETRAMALRQGGADLVIVAAHAGGGCKELDDPTDLSSCERDAEIFAVADALPRGLVDHIIAGHRHRFLAHEVNGIAITSNISGARAFGRVDYTVDRRTRKITQRRIFLPQLVCAYTAPGNPRCAQNDDPGAEIAHYEGMSVTPTDALRGIAQRAAQRADVIKNEPLGVHLDTPFTRANPPYSTIGRLMTDAIREATGTDVAIHNVVGGIRADLPAGALTFGDVYRAFPFDNRISVLELSTGELKTLLANQVHNLSRRAGVSGLHINVRCVDGAMSIDLERPNGDIAANDDVFRVVANDFLLLGGDNIFTPITPTGGYTLDASQPRVRDVWAQWFRSQPGNLSADDYGDDAQLRWHLPDPLPTDCHWSGH
ncbi:MAG: bifunctional UDP-sugar hydrolase/5'-nucleotidase [Gammaproteobacteria bacterium]